MHCTREILPGLLWVGADNRRPSSFEGVYDVPNGMSYNSYLLLDEKTALFDTVDRSVADQFLENLEYGLAGRKLDYLVIHHMEFDHAAAIEEVLLRHPEATVVCGELAARILSQASLNDLSDHLMTVKEGDKLSLGSHELQFIAAPMVHWPEVMMSYETSQHILFSADAFGAFGALNGRLFADEVDFMNDWLDEARRYYVNIVGKYGPQVQMALNKVSALPVEVVCPLHAFVWRKHFGDYLEKYQRWSRYEPEQQGVTLAYASVYGHTENAANILAALLSEKGVKVEMFDTSMIPASYIIASAFKNSHLVLASTTYNAGIFVKMEDLLRDLAAHDLQDRKVALIENGSWGPYSGKLMRDILAPLKGTEFITDTITMWSAPKPDTYAALQALADKIAADIAPAGAAPQPVTVAGVQPLPVQDKAFFNFTYGVEVATTRVDGKDYGCIINTAEQVSAGDEKKVAISVIKKNYTAEMIQKSGLFNVSILTQEAPFALFEAFGFRSGRDVDKFADVPYQDRSANGVRYIPQYTNAMFSCEVTAAIDVGASMLFVGRVVEAKVLSDAPSCTYGYYREHIKPKPQPAQGQKEGWRCTVCGYFYEGHELPRDFVCPLCKHGPEAFVYVPAVEVKKKKGFICKVCGYFYEGETLPADFICPICHHGAEDFEPAEQ